MTQEVYQHVLAGQHRQVALQVEEALFQAAGTRSAPVS